MHLALQASLRVKLHRQMNLVEEIRQSWGWIGIEPVEVVGENDLGNLIVKDEEGKYWRLSPEDCNCTVVAEDRQALDTLSADQEFLHDWYMRALVSLANDVVGPLSESRKYCLKIPSVLCGAYAAENLAAAPLVDLIRASGDIARQIKDLPDGAQVKLRIVD
jgi:Domain of unknown function (DUF1851)